MKTGKCHVPRCTLPADYRVSRVWYGSYPEEDEHQSEDEKCPYICHKHMEENVAYHKVRSAATGFSLVPNYLYTESPGNKGWHHYEPIPTTHTVLYEAPFDSLSFNIETLNANLMFALQRQPELVHSLSPRQFEFVVADIFKHQGFNVELTKQSRDGGIDIYAAKSDLFGQLLYVIECKQYAPTNRVGINVVQRIYGVARSIGATKGVVVTTSSFTKPAIEFAAPLRYSLNLNDYEKFVEWLKATRKV